MLESKITECIRSVYPNAIVNIANNAYGFKIEVIDNFTDSSDERLRKIFTSLQSLEVGLKAKIGLVETYLFEEYARLYANDNLPKDIQTPCENIRWVDSPNIIGFIACGVKDDPSNRICESSFILASKDKLTGVMSLYGENFIYESAAYSFITRNGENMRDYALSHVYNLAPSFFIAPYMDLYMKENNFEMSNPYRFAFLPLPFTFARPTDNTIQELNAAELRQKIQTISVPSLRERLNHIFLRA